MEGRVSVSVWVLYKFKWLGMPDMGIVSKKMWQSRYAGKRHPNRLLTDIEYIMESTDKEMLEMMKNLAKEK